SGRQAIDRVGVIRRRLQYFAALDRPAERALAADETVDDGRVGLQLHLFLQAVGEHGGDAAALVGAAGLFLDDRGQRYQLLRRFQGNIRTSMLPDLGDQTLLCRLHALDHLLARGATRELVSLRQQGAFARNLVD